MNKKKNNKGFSLIELIIAIAILIILTGLLAPQFMKYIEKSRLAKDMQTLDTVYTAVQGAISDEAAHQDLVTVMAGTSDAGNVDTAAGCSLVDLMGTTTFGAELRALVGKDAGDINTSFQSRLAAESTSGTTPGHVCVSIDSDMQIVVTFGTAANAPASNATGSLIVGSNSLVTITP